MTTAPEQQPTASRPTLRGCDVVRRSVPHGCWATAALEEVRRNRWRAARKLGAPGAIRRIKGARRKCAGWMAFVQVNRVSAPVDYHLVLSASQETRRQLTEL